MNTKTILFTTFALSLAGSAQAEEKSYGKALDEDMQKAAVVAVSENGDIVLFGGTVVVPFERPSVEKCGVHMSKPAATRTADASKVRREASDYAVKQRYSPREKAKYVRLMTQPLKECEKRFTQRCAEIKKEASVEVRKGAVEEAKKSIQRLAKGPTEKKAVQGYLDNVLAACALTN